MKFIVIHSRSFDADCYWLKTEDTTPYIDEAFVFDSNNKEHMDIINGDYDKSQNKLRLVYK